MAGNVKEKGETRLSLQSFSYFGFLALTALLYLHLPRRFQPPFLLAASWLFYAAAMPAMLPLLAALCAFTYGCGRGLSGAHKTAFLRLGVIGSLAVLAFFKYFNFLAGLFPWGLRLPALALPLGISFYTFAAVSYLVDAARGDCPVERSFVRYALFLSLFATVTQGPICRAGLLLPQFDAEHRFDAARCTRALRLFALGLFKTVAVSDVLGVLVDNIFAHYAEYGGLMLLTGAVGYTLQLYFNFSGYSELARASGLFLGLELPENFKTPLFSTNFSELWSRWHISFSSWLQDYLFTPLVWADVSGPTRGRMRRLPPLLCIFLVFFLSGFWHGSTLPFIVWGFLQAVYRVGEELLHRRFGKPKKRAPARRLWAKRAVVFCLWCASEVFFRVGMGPNPQPRGVADAVRFLGGCVRALSPARFAGELYAALYADFYAHSLMIALYVAFLLAALALAFWLDGRRCFRYKNQPAELALAAEKHRTLLYLLLIVFILVGFILQSGGFGSSGFGMYAGF